MSRQKLLLAVFLLLSLPLFGQYSATYSKSGADMLNSATAPPNHGNYNCVSKNCFVNLPSTPAFTQVSSSATVSDMEVQAVDGSGNRWHWVVSSGTWEEITDSLSGQYKAIHVGSVANGYYLALTTAASGNAYYWEAGRGWVQSSPTQTCVDGAVASNATTLCVDASGNPYFYYTGQWFLMTGITNVAAITANEDVAVAVTTSGAVYLWRFDGLGPWEAGGSMGFTPAATKGSIALADDYTLAVLDTAGNIQVSHDGTATWSAVNHSSFPNSFTPAAVAHSAGMNSFALATTGQVWHLNAIVPAGSIAVTGSCGSACGSGNPQVNFTFNTSEVSEGSLINVALDCAGWTYASGDPPETCTLAENADTVLNTNVLAALVQCDGFVKANDNKCATEVIDLYALLALSGLRVLNSDNSCECARREVIVNQKYYVLNNYNNPPKGSGLWGIGAFFGLYHWAGTQLQQWCIGTYTPILDALNPVGGTDLQYTTTGPAPTKMPGRYVNGDIPAEVDIATGTDFEPILFPAPVLRVYNTNFFSGQPNSIYTWNNTDTRQRGPGGDPTQVCGGYKILD